MVFRLCADLKAMGRIFVGLCQVGAWGCFDEFNRLEERMLSAVSQQVQTIQEALKEHASPEKDSMCMSYISPPVPAILIIFVVVDFYFSSVVRFLSHRAFADSHAT